MTLSPVVAAEAPPRTAELSDLARATCRALAADAAVFLDVAADQPPGILGEHGFTATELDVVVAALHAHEPVTGFSATRVERMPLEGGGMLVLCVGARTMRTFENATLTAAFMRHAAIAVAGARERAADPPVGRRGEPVAAGALGARLLDGLDYPGLIDAVTAHVAPAVGRAKVGLYVFDADLRVLQMLPGSLGAPAHLAAAGRTPVGDWESSVARVFATGRPYVTNAAAGDPGVLQDYLAALGLTRILGVALEFGGRRVGILQVADKEGGDFTARDLCAIEELAPPVAQALALTRQRSELIRRQRLEEILGGVAVDIASGKNLQDFLGCVLDEVCLAIVASTVALVPVDGEPLVWRRNGERLELEHIVVAEAREASGVRSYVVPPRRVGDPGWAAMHMPVRENEGRVGTLAALRHHGEPFAPDERHALSRLANLIALAWATEHYQLRRAALARHSERQRIGDALHDHTAQLLFAARLRLDAALETPGVPPATAESATLARSLVVRADDAIREVIHDLSDRGQEGLDDLLAAVVAAVESEFGRPVQLELAPAAIAAGIGLRRPVADLVAKVAREALVNAAKHAGPGQLTLRVAVLRRHHLLVAIADDGVGGARVGRDGHGLSSLRRAVRRQGGSLRVRTAATGGTTVTASLPL